MYTLKIKWFRYEDGKVVDEATLFIPADSVTAHGVISSDDQMKSWEPGSWLNYRSHGTQTDKDDHVSDGRLISVTRDNKDSWYVCSQAWLLGPDGKTIERLN